MAETVQKNFRMSQKSIRTLHEVARALGVTETDVVETCVAKFALSIGQDVDRARELLFEQFCGAIAKVPDDVANIYISKDLLVPLDRLAEKRNTTRGKLVEDLLREAGAVEEIAAEGHKRRRDVAGTSNAESRSAGPNVESTGHSAAGALASMVGERWTEGKKEKEKKK